MLLCAGVAVGAIGVTAAPATAAPGAAVRPALLAPEDPATGDPPPPAGADVPDGLDEPTPPIDDSIVDSPPTDPAITPNANALRIAWLGTPAERPVDPAGLVTLQVALNTVAAGGTVSFDPGDYAFTGALTVARSVTIDSSAASTLYSRFTVSAGGLALGADVAIAAAATGAIVQVTGSDVALRDVTVRNPTPVARPIGVQLAAGVTGVVIDGLTMNGAGEASSYGVNLTTGSATITDAAISGVATGIAVTAAATTSGIQVTGGTIAAQTAGISLGSATAPLVTGVEVSGTPGTGTGIDLANSSSAVVDGVTVDGFARGIGTATTNAAAGPTITDATITGTSREGIALGATAAPSVVRPRITGADAAQSTGILVLRSTQTEIEDAVVTGMMYGITTHLDNTGQGPVITSPQITAFGAVTLGSTQGASVTGAVVDAGAWGPGGTGVNLVNAGRATVTALTATGFLYAIGSQSSMLPGSDRADISISDVTATGAPDASSGIYLLGAVDAVVSDVEAELTGAALVVHQSTGVTASGIVVHGREGPTSVTGAAILRAYGSQGVHVDGASIDAGSYGFFYSATDGATVVNATVEGVVERALYGRSVANLEVSGSTLADNGAAGLFVVTNPGDGISHDVRIHDVEMTGNGDGIRVLQGTSDVAIEGNTVSGQPAFVTAGGAHRLTIAGNTVEQADGAVAVSVEPLWQDGALAGSYSSSGIRVQGNVFRGTGTWISVGTADSETPEAERRTLRDPVLVTGNVFPAASTAVVTFPNAVEGEDAAPALQSLPDGGPVAVDARDYDDPNDWGSACRATGYLDGALWYDGGGAAVRELAVAPVLYPMTCIDLSLTEQLAAPDGALRAGDTLSWTLTPHNAGPRAAPAGWSITQLLPSGVELVGMSGDGYARSGDVATAAGEIPAGEDGPPLTIVARVVAVPVGAATMRNVAYVAPASPSDLDGDGFVDTVVEQFGPLVVPTIDTDTDASPTDNDAQGVWAVTAGSGGGGGGSKGGGLASTGAEPLVPLVLGLLVIEGGILTLRRSRRVAPFS
ncbi:hypothetical protein GCM10010196_07410 [Agromyces mediolanus]|uniref:Right handed beta helix domain-containing protein n=1 Tax=Agromyces mediolanus TaxID=41986 RepID=A0A918FAQ7_AGRME|nr:hypothetical protein GCM10010196_07410 [Agromyces mediolanus]GLJ71647.1 hypothetical protein GCM10017583_09030 [Agromyces mediolanus]